MSQQKAVNEVLNTVIIKQFEALPAELLANPAIKSLHQLRTQILDEVQKRFVAKPQ